MLAIGTLAKRTGTKVQTIRYAIPASLAFRLKRSASSWACQTRPNVLALRSMLSPKGSSAKSRQGLCGSRHSALNCSG